MSWQGNKNNPVPNNLQLDKGHSDLKIGDNRAFNTRRDKDTIKYPGISLIDIDEAIIKYLDEHISPRVVDMGNSIKVPVIYGSPERWNSAKKDGVFRDFNGKIQLPVLMVKRASFTKNESLMTLNRHLTYPVLTNYTEKNKYDKFSLITKTGVKPVNAIYSVTCPDHIKITYNFMIWTELVEQMNAITEKINFAAEDYWGDEKRFRFRVYMGDYTNNMEVSTGQDRMVKTEFSATVMAYLLPDSFEDRQATVQKILTPRKIIISEEVTEHITKKNVDERRIKADFIDNYIVLKDDIKDDMEQKNLKQAFSNLVTRTVVVEKDEPIWHTPPRSSTDYGQEGWMAYDGNFHYIYVNGSWKRQPITNFNNF